MAQHKYFNYETCIIVTHTNIFIFEWRQTIETMQTFQSSMHKFSLDPSLTIMSIMQAQFDFKHWYQNLNGNEMSLRTCKKAKNHASTLKIEIKLIIAANINVTEPFYPNFLVRISYLKINWQSDEVFLTLNGCRY